MNMYTVLTIGLFALLTLVVIATWVLSRLNPFAAPLPNPAGEYPPLEAMVSEFLPFLEAHYKLGRTAFEAISPTLADSDAEVDAGFYFASEYFVYAVEFRFQDTNSEGDAFTRHTVVGKYQPEYARAWSATYGIGAD